MLKDNKAKSKKFDNNINGFRQLSQWLQIKGVDTAYACMEATGSYGAKLAEYLYENNFKVSVVNPARIKGFALSKLSRVKTDKADSELIARFCQAMQPELWQPTILHIQELQQWVKRLDVLIANRHQENNRLDCIDHKLHEHIKRHIEFLEKEIKEVETIIANHIKNHQDLEDKRKLLDSIPGIGEKTISIILISLVR